MRINIKSDTGEFFPEHWNTKNQGHKKNVLILQVGGSVAAPPTQPVIRIVLLHTEQIVQSYLSSSVLSKDS